VTEATPGPAETFRLGYVPGATPGKWARTWRERLPDVELELVPLAADEAVAAIDDGVVDAAILRLPRDRALLGDHLNAIPLYEELPVVVVSRDHLLAASEPEELVTTHDIVDDVVWLPLDDVLFGEGAPVPGRAPASGGTGDGTGDDAPTRPPTAADAVAWAATGAGVTVLPMSLARLHHRKDVTQRVLDDGPLAPVGLAWRSDRTTDLVDEMVGIVRGRTVNSSRGRGGAARRDAAASAAAAQAKKGSGKQAPRRGTQGAGSAGRSGGSTGRPRTSGRGGRRRRA